MKSNKEAMLRVLKLLDGEGLTAFTTAAHEAFLNACDDVNLDNTDASARIWNACVDERDNRA